MGDVERRLVSGRFCRRCGGLTDLKRYLAPGKPTAIVTVAFCWRCHREVETLREPVKEDPELNYLDLIKYGKLIDDVVDILEDADDTLKDLDVGAEARLNPDDPIKMRARGKAKKKFHYYIVAERVE